MRSQLNIGRAVSFLMRRYGDNGTAVALRRAHHSAARNDPAAENEWRLVMAALTAYLSAEPDGPPH
jgi:hypothetical protein